MRVLIELKIRIGYRTMEKFRKKVMLKMGVEGVAQLVMIAIKLGLLHTGGETTNQSEFEYAGCHSPSSSIAPLQYVRAG